ncbi:RNA polymerase sigma factor [Xylanimonas protaetiae]|uniref:Putative zinc-finger domain-containing protein n=1 Tax=Xylanimonas protaetiae TaxID=2509457 RepID=A0A4P6F2J8_9MICO|nr:zf-HC2 domain-containing protein [Xylanimonas protaetiae]QAY69446.1 hypothetical protein ET471_04830 [Xylanimonas protaetiae]
MVTRGQEPARTGVRAVDDALGRMRALAPGLAPGDPGTADPDLVRAALAALPHDDQRLLWLKHVDAADDVAIAKSLGLSLAAVPRRLRQAERNLAAGLAAVHTRAAAAEAGACTTTRGALGDYVRHRLPARTRQVLEAHLFGCQDCMRAFIDVRQAGWALRDAAPLLLAGSAGLATAGPVVAGALGAPAAGAGGVLALAGAGAGLAALRDRVVDAVREVLLAGPRAALVVGGSAASVVVVAGVAAAVVLSGGAPSPVPAPAPAPSAPVMAAPAASPAPAPRSVEAVAEPSPVPSQPTSPQPTPPSPTPGPSLPGPSVPVPTTPGPTRPGPTRPGPTTPRETPPIPTTPSPAQPSALPPAEQQPAVVPAAPDTPAPDTPAAEAPVAPPAVAPPAVMPPAATPPTVTTPQDPPVAPPEPAPTPIPAPPAPTTRTVVVTLPGACTVHGPQQLTVTVDGTRLTRGNAEPVLRGLPRDGVLVWPAHGTPGVPTGTWVLLDLTCDPHDVTFMLSEPVPAPATAALVPVRGGRSTPVPGAPVPGA